MAAKSETLQRVLSEFPGLEQADPAENGKFIRFTVQLKIDLLDHHQSPEIFLLFTRYEFEQAMCIEGGLELAFRQKLEHHSFKDADSGNTVETSIQKDSSGLWRAKTIDGLW